MKNNLKGKIVNGLHLDEPDEPQNLDVTKDLNVIRGKKGLYQITINGKTDLKDLNEGDVIKVEKDKIFSITNIGD